jgi:hypothetical protein
LQLLDLNPDALNLNLPSLSARPVTVLSADETAIVAFAFAPLPSTAKVPDVLRDAFVTLTAANALDGATSTDATTSSRTSDANFRALENILLERCIVVLPCSRTLASMSSRSPPHGEPVRPQGQRS